VLRGYLGHISDLEEETMKIQELIEILRKYDPDKDVEIESSWGEYSPKEIRRVSVEDGCVVLREDIVGMRKT